MKRAARSYPLSRFFAIFFSFSYMLYSIVEKYIYIYVCVCVYDVC